MVVVQKQEDFRENTKNEEGKVRVYDDYKCLRSETVGSCGSCDDDAVDAHLRHVGVAVGNGVLLLLHNL